MNKIFISCAIGLVSITQLIVSAWAKTSIQYGVARDEFSNSNVSRLTLVTDDTEPGGLILSCYPSGLQAQLHVEEVIFPTGADVEAGKMWIKITHKVDMAAAAVTNSWQMNLGKYKDAWLVKGVGSLIKEMQSGAHLSMKLDKVGTIYRFDLEESHDQLSKVLDSCTKQGQQKQGH